MSRWWTPAHDAAASGIAVRIKQAQENGNRPAEDAAWRDYFDLHGVKFTIVQRNAAGNSVGEPVVLTRENDADDCAAHLPHDETAKTAVLFRNENPAEIRKTWEWDGESESWKPKA